MDINTFLHCSKYVSLLVVCCNTGVIKKTGQISERTGKSAGTKATKTNERRQWGGTGGYSVLQTSPAWIKPTFQHDNIKCFKCLS